MRYERARELLLPIFAEANQRASDRDGFYSLDGIGRPKSGLANGLAIVLQSIAQPIGLNVPRTVDAIDFTVDEILPGQLATKQLLKAADANHSHIAMLVSWNLPPINDALPE
jgi:hypothetical protein